jgi:hypothetical protein
MTAEELRATVDDERPPNGLNPLVEALWWDAKGDWSRAHEIAQDITSPDASWVHAYLHRKEGDASNADYWYRRAGKSHARQPLPSEWGEIVDALLTARSS